MSTIIIIIAILMGEGSGQFRPPEPVSAAAAKVRLSCLDFNMRVPSLCYFPFPRFPDLSFKSPLFPALSLTLALAHSRSLALSLSRSLALALSLSRSRSLLGNVFEKSQTKIVMRDIFRSLLDATRILYYSKSYYTIYIYIYI